MTPLRLARQGVGHRRSEQRDMARGGRTWDRAEAVLMSIMRRLMHVAILGKCHSSEEKAVRRGSNRGLTGRSFVRSILGSTYRRFGTTGPSKVSFYKCRTYHPHPYTTLRIRTFRVRIPAMES